MQEGVEDLADLLEDPNLSEDALEQVKTVTLGEIQRKSTDLDYVAGRTLKELMFKNTVLSLPAIGTTASVSELKLQDIKAFMDEYIVTSGAICVMGGDLSVDEANASVQKILSSLKKGKKRELTYYKVTPKEEKKIVRNKKKQTYMYFDIEFDIKKMIPILEKHPVPNKYIVLKKPKKIKSGIDIYLKGYKGNITPLAIKLNAEHGNAIEKSNTKGQITVINFWATCGHPFKQEKPSEKRLKKKMKGLPFELITINYAEEKKNNSRLYE